MKACHECGCEVIPVHHGGQVLCPSCEILGRESQSESPELTKLKSDVARLRQALEPLAAQSENESIDRTRTDYDSVSVPRMYLRAASRAFLATKG